MVFTWIDWFILALFFVITLLIGLRYASNAGENIGEFFLGGRNLPWWVAGTSMVATTFAADTPLLVAGLVAQNGISGNWLWWNMLLGGMLTTFFFAHLWRRSGVLTEPELIELRYSGKPASFLRGFKAVYLGLFMNVIIIGWINVAMMKILQGFFGIDATQSLLFVGAAMLFVAIYSAISGLMGVVITDAIQFIIAMTGCIILSIIVITSEKIGGISGLKAQLPGWSLSFFPAIGNGGVAGTAEVLSIGVGAFFARIGVQWWSSWYPGAEPGGGGYVAQRMMSCKDEKHAVYATLFFQIAHYALRPWPWILVGLASLVLYPELAADNKEIGFVYAMRDFLPVGLRGLLLAAFFAAYMSSVSTQLNWGASYLVNDLYKRFIKPQAGDKELVNWSRISTIFLMLVALFVTTQLTTIQGAWGFIIECGAGLGLVLILRWYWWRINAWSEISATIAPFIAFGAIKLIEISKLGELHAVYGNDIPAEAMMAFNKAYPYLTFPGSFFITVLFTTVVWLVVTFITQPEPAEHLRRFYDKVKPQGAWNFAGNALPAGSNSSMVTPLIGWLGAVVFVYAVLFFIGKLIFMEWMIAGILLAVALAAFFVVRQSLKKINF
jgi:SSS family solute:Na+ symporter